MDDNIEVKITVIGNGKTGKTSMLNLFKDHSFSSIYTPTSFDILTIERPYKSKNIKFNFWDTAGQEEFLRLAPLHLPNSDILILCFSCSDLKSFNSLHKWKTTIEYYCKDTPFILIGCKIDIRHNTEEIELIQKRGEYVVSTEMGVNKKIEMGAVGYFECSAKDNIGDKPILDFLYEWTYNHYVADQNGNESDSVNRKSKKGLSAFFDAIMRFCGCRNIEDASL